MLAKVTSKGQVTIPIEIRKKLGIRSEDKVDFILEEDRVILRPVKTLRDLRGAVQAKGKGDFAAERSAAKVTVARRVREELE
ncbi:MAG: AbrB/MazE/SpoVT family DNA-binding domain-containing protein [Desulfuromonadales bacterium]